MDSSDSSTAQTLKDAFSYKSWSSLLNIVVLNVNMIQRKPIPYSKSVYKYPRCYLHRVIIVFADDVEGPGNRRIKACYVTIEGFRKSHTRIKVNKMQILRFVGSKFGVKLQRCL